MAGVATTAGMAAVSDLTEGLPIVSQGRCAEMRGGFFEEGALLREWPESVCRVEHLRLLLHLVAARAIAPGMRAGRQRNGVIRPAGGFARVPNRLLSRRARDRRREARRQCRRQPSPFRTTNIIANRLVTVADECLVSGIAPMSTSGARRRLARLRFRELAIDAKVA